MPQQKTIDKAAPKTPTGAAAYLEMVEQGTLWTTPSGAVIRVRDLTIADRAMIDALPTTLQAVIYDVIDKSESLRGADDDDAESSMVAILGGEDKSLKIALDREYEIGAHFCVAGWIEPEVVLTPDEVTDPETQIPASKIPADDRRAFMARVFGADMAEAQKLATFPEPARRRVGARPDGPAVEANPG